MKSNPSDNSNSSLQNIFSWVKNTPERAINEAFESAVNIKRIEEEHFSNNKIANNGSFSSSVFSVFEIQLQKYISNIKTQLNFYKVSASLPYLQPQSSSNSTNTAIAKYTSDNDPVGSGQLSANQLGGNAKKFSIYQKLAFIDYTLDRYERASDRTIDVPTKPLVDGNSQPPTNSEIDNPSEEEDKFQLFKSDRPKKRRMSQPATTLERSILPGSFFKAFDRVKRNLSGGYTDYEKDIVEELRQSRERIKQASRYIVALIITVITVHFLSKALVFSPLINSLIDVNNMSVRFSPAIEERAFEELRLVKERIEFDFTIKSFIREQSQNQEEGKKLETNKPESKESVTNKPAEANKSEVNKPELSEKESVESLIQQESVRILKKYNAQSLDGVKNLLSDISAAFVFYLFLISGRNEWMTIKEFLDEVLYSLNDNAKAFLIIVSTDTFVGFHSSEGWDALITTIFQHFGLPENKLLAQLFISTVPVFLDGLFKFWIFQYLTQASPATATIYREMNE